MSQYTIDDTTSSGEIGNVIPPGLHSNVIVTKVAYEQATETNEQMVLAFYFATKMNGLTLELRHLQWEVDEEKTKQFASDSQRPHRRDDKRHGFIKGNTITPAQAVIIEHDNQNQKIKHIMTAFMKESETHIKADSWKTYCEGVVSKFTSEVLAQKVHLIVSLKNSGHSDLPLFPPFIERQHDGVPPRLRWNPKWHKDQLENPAPSTAPAGGHKPPSTSAPF